MLTRILGIVDVNLKITIDEFIRVFKRRYRLKWFYNKIITFYNDTFVQDSIDFKMKNICFEVDSIVNFSKVRNPNSKQFYVCRVRIHLVLKINSPTYYLKKYFNHR